MLLLHLLFLFFLDVYISLVLLDEDRSQPLSQYLIDHCFDASLHLSNKTVKAALDLVWTLHRVHLGFEFADFLRIAHTIYKNLKQATIID